MKEYAQVIRHAYESTVETSARLAAFASCQPTQSSDGLIDERQKLLAIDDLILFAVSARRWMEITNSLGKFSELQLDVVYDMKQCRKPVTRILNMIIHHRDFRISRFSYEVKTNPEYEDFLKENVKTFSPIVQVKSDHGKFVTFGLWDLVTKFEDNIINPLVGECADHGIYLDEELFT